MFDHARNTVIHNASVTEVRGDQHVHHTQGTTVVGNQHNYYSVQVRGVDDLHQRTPIAALFGSNTRPQQPRCMEDTRVDIIQRITGWLCSGIDTSTILWLWGPAGTGKTALAHTIAALCRTEQRLLAAFFFSNREATCSDGKALITALASQLAVAIPRTRYYMNEAMTNDPHLLSRSLELQMDQLIVQPIKQVSTIIRLFKWFGLASFPILVVIDGLDECSDKTVQQEILKTIANAIQDLRLPLRFLIASRPEPHLRRAMHSVRSLLPHDGLSAIELTDDDATRHDIRVYLMAKCDEIRALHDDVPDDWPNTTDIERLVDNASGQFIYATTIIAYISSPYYSPVKRLRAILGLEAPTDPEDNPYAQLDRFYALVVGDVKRHDTILQIMGQVIITKTMSPDANISGFSTISSPSPTTIGTILGLEPGDVQRCLTDMHSLVEVGKENEDIRIRHKSFIDFLLDESRSRGFHVNVEDAYIRRYSHTINSLQHRDTVIDILGQVIIVESISGSSEVDVFGYPSNSSSLSRIDRILCLQSGDARTFLNDLYPLLLIGDEHQNIKIRSGSFVDFLLGRYRSQVPLVKVEEARAVLGRAYFREISCYNFQSYFLSKYRPGINAELVASILLSAAKFSVAYGASLDLGEALAKVNLLGSWETIARLIPWATPQLSADLGRICPLLTEIGVPNLQPLNIDARLQAIRGKYTWEHRPPLNREHLCENYSEISLAASSSALSEFFRTISNNRLSIPTDLPCFAGSVCYKSSSQDDHAIIFYIHNVEDMKPHELSFSFKDSKYRKWSPVFIVATLSAYLYQEDAWDLIDRAFVQYESNFE